MSVKPSAIYNKQTDELVGLINTNNSKLSELGVEQKLANSLLCFIFTGLSTHFRLPITYYFTRGLSGEELSSLIIEAIRSIEEIGFVVDRISTGNHKINVKAFSVLADGQLLPEIDHPLDEGRFLYLSFNPCHILKNLRNQLMSRVLKFKGNISFYFIRRIYNLQQKKCHQTCEKSNTETRLSFKF